MKIILTPEESEQYFHNALCNGLDYICSGYGLSLKYSDIEYREAANSLKESGASPCYEDVLMQILRDGKKLSLVDEEGGEDNWSISLGDVHERVSSAPINHLMDMIQENDDAETADVILQSVFIEEIMFG